MADISTKPDSRCMEWQPIETAPKDGMDEVLIAWADGIRTYTVTNARWHSTKKQWVNTWMAFTKHPSGQPTHWMPRPDPPTAHNPDPKA